MISGGNQLAHENPRETILRMDTARLIIDRGALGFGLKAIARPMHSHGLIETNWGDGSTDGLGAMVGAWTAAREASATGRKLSEMPLVNQIEAYNEVDCKMMMKIVRYLRANH